MNDKSHIDSKAPPQSTTYLSFFLSLFTPWDFLFNNSFLFLSSLSLVRTNYDGWSLNLYWPPMFQMMVVKVRYSQLKVMSSRTGREKKSRTAHLDWQALVPPTKAPMTWLTVLPSPPLPISLGLLLSEQAKASSNILPLTLVFVIFSIWMHHFFL